MVKTGPFDHKMTHLTSKTKKKFDSLFDHQSGQKMTHLAIKTRNLRKFSMVKSGPFDHKKWSKNDTFKQGMLLMQGCYIKSDFIFTYKRMYSPHTGVTFVPP